MICVVVLCVRLGTSVAQDKGVCADSGGCHWSIFTNLRMREHCVVHIVGTEGHFVFGVTLTFSSTEA